MTPAFTITVAAEDGTDLTDTLARHRSVDGWTPGAEGRAREDVPIGDLSGLTRSEAVTCLAQIIDQGHEHGTVDVDGLYRVASMIDSGELSLPVSFKVPDGWTVTVNGN